MTNIVHKASAGRVADTPTFVLTTQTADRVGDIVMLDGLDTKDFLQNPVALVHHQMGEFPVGVWTNLRKSGDALLGDLQLAVKGTSRMADTARSLIEQGILRAVSVTFRGLEREQLKPKGVRFTKSELLEVSLVSVPMNPRALMVAKSLNLTEQEMKAFFTDAEPGENGEDDEEAKRKSARFEAVDTRARLAVIAAKRACRPTFGEL